MVIETSASDSTSSVNVENERRSKRKQDLVQEEEDNGSESESESESGEEEKQQVENTENENSKQKGVISSDQQKGEANTEKGLISANETPTNQVMEVQESLVKASSSFKRKFSLEDEEKILQTLVDKRVTGKFLAFWKNCKDPVQLSVPMCKLKISEKSRKLKKKYVMIFNKGKSPPANKHHEHGRRIYDLAKQLWGENGIERQQQLAVEQQHHVKKVKTGKNDEKNKMIVAVVDDDMQFRRDYDDFLTGLRDGAFPIALALKVVKPSERLELEKMWEENRARDKKLMAKILKGLRPPPED